MQWRGKYWVTGDREGQKAEAMALGRREGWCSVHRQRRQAELGMQLTTRQYRKGGWVIGCSRCTCVMMELGEGFLLFSSMSQWDKKQGHQQRGRMTEKVLEVYSIRVHISYHMVRTYLSIYLHHHFNLFLRGGERESVGSGLEAIRGELVVWGSVTERSDARLAHCR